MLVLLNETLQKSCPGGHCQYLRVDRSQVCPLCSKSLSLHIWWPWRSTRGSGGLIWPFVTWEKRDSRYLREASRRSVAISSEPRLLSSFEAAETWMMKAWVKPRARRFCCGFLNLFWREHFCLGNTGITLQSKSLCPLHLVFCLFFRRWLLSLLRKRYLSNRVVSKVTIDNNIKSIIVRKKA